MGEDQVQRQDGGMAVTEGMVPNGSAVGEAEDNELTGATDGVWG